MKKQTDQQIRLELDKVRLANLPSVRLEYLRKQILAECISYGELVELRGLIKYIEPSDTLLLEWAGKPEEIELCPMCESHKLKTQKEISDELCESCYEVTQEFVK